MYLGKYRCRTNDKAIFSVYTVDNGFGYEMGIEVLDDDNADMVMVTLFHWESEEQKKTLQHFASNEEQCSFLKVYKTQKGRYFNYPNSGRIYLPN